MIDNRTTWFFIVLFVSTIQVFSQEQPVHEKRTFRDTSGRLYVNKALPIYLHLSTTPDASSGAHRLQSESTPEYANPFYFDSEGYNTIRTPWRVNPETRQVVQPRHELIFEVYADSKPPQSSIDFPRAKRYRNHRGEIFYGKNTQIRLSAKDAVSGTENIYFALDSKNFKPYEKTFSVETQGQHTLKFYAADNVGNAEEVHSRTFTIDATPPEVIYSVNGTITNDIISPNASIILKSNDKLSGVKNVKYYFDNNKPRLYTRPIKLSELSDGEHTLTFIATDNVGNVGVYTSNDESLSSLGSYKFYLDRSVPFVSASIVGDQYAGKYLYVSPRSKCQLESNDNKGGVQQINYGINASANTNTYSQPFEMPTQKGLHTIFYIATDKVENTTPVNKMQIYVDNVAPQSEIRFSQPTFSHRDTLFISPQTNVEILSDDAQSGIQKIEFALDGQNLQEYTEFSVPDGGFHTIKYLATDRVNNTEPQKKQEVVVDDIPPEIVVTFSIKPIGNQEGLDVYPPYTRMYIGATDRYVGTQKISYSVNGGAMKNYASPGNIAAANMLSKQQNYTIKIVAEDKLGNLSEKEIQFKVAAQ